MKTPHEFYLETNGKVIDVDGYYGGQCWDLWTLFCQEYCNKVYGCRWSGGVKDMWYHFDELGLGEFFEKIPPEKYHELQDGDWLVWDQDTNPLCWISTARNEKGETYGHIAMFRKYNDDNSEQNIILTQNPNGNPNYTYQMVCDFLGFVGALRPKCYITQETPQNSTKEENNINIPEEPENNENESNGDDIELINSDKESVILFILEKICNLIRKITEIIFRKDNEK